MEAMRRAAAPRSASIIPCVVSRSFSSQGGPPRYRLNVFKKLDQEYLAWSLKKMSDTVEQAERVNDSIKGLADKAHRWEMPQQQQQDPAESDPDSRVQKGPKYRDQLRDNVGAAGETFVPPLYVPHRTRGHEYRQFAKNIYTDTPPPAQREWLKAESGEGDGEGYEGSSSRREEFSDLNFAGEEEEDVFARYESLKDEPLYQDLTHEEARKMQELQMRRKLLDRRMRWLKMNMLPNPQKDAKMYLRQVDSEAATNDDDEEERLYPPPFMDERPDSPRITRMVNETRHLEVESRLRARIREEKWEVARILKEPAPTVGGVVLDHQEYHVQRRTVRIGRLIQSALEQVITCTTPQILHEMLGGASITVNHIEQRTYRSRCYVYYSLVSDHDPEEVQQKLDTAAPKIRYELARRLELVRTPEIAFRRNDDGSQFDKHRLMSLHMSSDERRARARRVQSTFASVMNHVK
ncbi:unnamed protein product [Vitrella brassicaformis CCMP3155]|uniref:Ribosome-binding factor A n=2 Tax=Vitrella brassicaformis TaxID=1169539 RepID=A0A0G4EL95_VITBC|nr:unnamed protein product [Vitrella brassicaformis CCMP3155]|eukprot:CEL97951.1 unnamed protein product [Vitrella brassicaformis CCMP3155]